MNKDLSPLYEDVDAWVESTILPHVKPNQQSLLTTRFTTELYLYAVANNKVKGKDITYYQHYISLLPQETMLPMKAMGKLLKELP